MSEVSIFIDESGDSGSQSRYYALAVVVHNQDQEVQSVIARYEGYLAESGLPNIPLHTEPLLNGHKDYQNFSIGERVRLLNAFNVMAQHLPYKYGFFIYEKRHLQSKQMLERRIESDIHDFIMSNLQYFQGFDEVKVYYDHGQQIVTHALHRAIESAVSKRAVTYRISQPSHYRLSQLADFICTIELTALKYESHQETKTNTTFFGTRRKLKENYLKKIRKHRL